MISAPATLFTKIYLDIMLLPKAQGYCYIVAAQDDVSGAAEGWKLKKASACVVPQFIFEELICCCGNIAEIITDNGSEAKGATAENLRCHNIPQFASHLVTLKPMELWNKDTLQFEKHLSKSMMETFHDGQI